MNSSSDAIILAKQLEEAQRRMNIIRRVSGELNAISNLSDKLNNILQILHAQFGIEHSMIALPDLQQEILVVQASYGYTTRPDAAIPFGSGIIGLAASNKQPINITGLRRKRQYLRAVSPLLKNENGGLFGIESPDSQIAIPLLSNSQLVAVLMAESENSSVFSKDDETFLITLSQPIAVSIQNAMLFDNMEMLIAVRTEALEKSNYTKDRLFSIISHDLRGPITSFHNISKLVHHYNKQGDKEKIDSLSLRIDQSVNRLNHLLDNLLNWSISQTDGIQCHFQNLNVLQLLQEVCGVYEEQMLAKTLLLKIEVDSNHFVLADYHTLSVVFRNIISNALKYTPRGGSILLKAETNSDQVIITCTDTGIGIPADKLQALFELSENKTTQGTENEKGTGLGLLVARDFVQLNKGKIKISSDIQKGTLVAVELPRFL